MTLTLSDGVTTIRFRSLDKAPLSIKREALYTVNTNPGSIAQQVVGLGAKNAEITISSLLLANSGEVSKIDEWIEENTEVTLTTGWDAPYDDPTVMILAYDVREDSGDSGAIRLNNLRMVRT